MLDQFQNPSRRNDYTATLFSPSAVSLGEVTVADTLGALNEATAVTLDLTDTVLSDPGVYTLVIKGVDFTGTNETGSHTRIDNLSINGTVTPIPEPSSTALLGLGGLALIMRRRK